MCAAKLHRILCSNVTDYVVPCLSSSLAIAPAIRIRLGSLATGPHDSLSYASILFSAGSSNFLHSVCGHRLLGPQSEGSGSQHCG